MFSVGFRALIVCAMLGALVLLPALLLLLGDRVAMQGVGRPDRIGSAMRVFAHAVMRRPVLSALLTTAFLLTLGAPILRMKSVLPDARIFPRESEVRRVDEILESELGFGKDPLTPILVAARAGSSFASPGEIERLMALMERILELPGVDRVTSPFAQGALTDPERARQAILQPETIAPDERRFVEQTVADDLAVLYVYGVAPWRSDEAGGLVRAIRTLPDSLAAVRFAKQREQDTILFYMEMRAMIPERDRAAGRVTVTGPETFDVNFAEPLSAITPGQAAVVYDGRNEKLLGGGWID